MGHPKELQQIIKQQIYNQTTGPDSAIIQYLTKRTEPDGIQPSKMSQKFYLLIQIKFAFS